MDNKRYARILQNMIEEAEENLDGLAERMKGYENLEHLDERRAELKEAMELQAVLSESERGEASGEEIRYVGPGALTKEQIDIHIIRRYLDTAPRKSITDKEGRRLAISSLDRLSALLASRPQPKKSDPRGADRLAREVARLIERRVIDGRSPAADALLAYGAPKNGSAQTVPMRLFADVLAPPMVIRQVLEIVGFKLEPNMLDTLQDTVTESGKGGGQ